MASIPQYVRAARTQECPLCGAFKGDPCRTTSGKATYLHSARMRLTDDAYFIGIEEGLRTAISYIDWQVNKSGVNTTVDQVRRVIEGDLALICESNSERRGV